MGCSAALNQDQSYSIKRFLYVHIYICVCILIHISYMATAACGSATRVAGAASWRCGSANVWSCLFKGALLLTGCLAALFQHQGCRIKWFVYIYICERWEDKIRELCGIPLTTAERRAKDRNRWRKDVVCWVARGQRALCN